MRTVVYMILLLSFSKAFAGDGDPSAGPCFLETKKTHRVKAELVTDIAHPNATVDEWYVYAPEVPSLPDQTAVKTSFSPEGKIIDEDSPLKRKLILMRVTDGRKELHTELTIEATLMSRHLRRLAPGQVPPAVPDLSPEEIQHFTRMSVTEDYEDKAFRVYLDAGSLLRKPDESDLAFARRGISWLKHHFTYQYPTPSHTAAQTAAAGKSDCGGLSAVFVATMRANGVPARLLGGRWASSQEGDDGKFHCKSEFFAKGIGWIPVDSSGAVTDTSGVDYACMGHDNGDFIAFGEDEGFAVDSFVAGKSYLPLFQGLAYWWRGSGPDTGGSYKEHWTVTREK